MTAKNPFQGGGFSSHVGELRKQMEREIRPLQEQLKAATDKQARGELKQRIRKITDEFKQQEKKSGYLLFSRR